MEKDDVEICVASYEDLKFANDLRMREFVVKQNIPVEKEFDKNNCAGTPIVAKVDDVVVGYMHIRYYADALKFERLVVEPKFQNRGISKKLLNFSIDFCVQKGFKTPIVSVCRKELLPQWERFGFKRNNEEKPLLVNGTSFYPIQYNLSKAPQKKLNFRDYFSSEEDIGKTKEKNAKISGVLASVFLHAKKQNS